MPSKQTRHDWRPGPQNLRLVASLLVSALAHGLILNAPGTPFGQGAKGGSASPLTVSLPAPRTETSAAGSIAPAVLTTSPNSAARTPEAAAAAETSVPAVPVPETAPAPPAEPVSTGGIVNGPWYYPARYLHRRPTPLRPIRPEYPAPASDVAGKVLLILLINEHGDVDQARIDSATPAGVFEASVIEAFTGAKYTPGLITGYPVKSQLLIEVIFEPSQPVQANFTPRETIVIPGPPAAGN